MIRGSNFTLSARFGAFAALAGSALLLLGILWLYFAPSLALGEASGLLSGVFGIVGPLGVALTTASLIGLYFVIARLGGSTALLWATLAVLIVLLSLVALFWIFLENPPFSSASVDAATLDPPPLFTLSALMVAWIRPLGILFFAFALVREDILFGRALLLFLICLFEAPLISNTILYLAGPSLSVEWPALLFGIPGVQTGVLGAVAWFFFGLSLLLLSREA